VDDRIDSYERLEFLGDSVLGLALAAHLFHCFPLEQEGRLAKLKAYVVSRGSCAQVAEQLGLAELVLERAPGTEEQRRELVANRMALGNALEALVGACYLEHGFAETASALVVAFRDQVTFAASYYVDYKSTLQEHLAISNKRVHYRLVREEGPPHRRIFTSEALMDGLVRGRGVGRSIKTSEQEAAREVLVSLGVIAPEGEGHPPLQEGDSKAPAPDDTFESGA